MLSSIGRAAARRLVTRVPQLSTARPSFNLWILQRADVSDNYSLSLARFYATTATKVKATKPKAKAKPKANTKPKPKAKVKRTTATKSKSGSTKAQTKAKKKPARKVAKKKSQKKSKSNAKGRPRMSEAQRDARIKARMKEIKSTALIGQQPALKVEHAWQLFVAESLKGSSDIISKIKALGADYKALAPSELEQLNHKANENAAANSVAYKKWVQSHSPEQIRLANLARQQLARQRIKATGLKSRKPIFRKIEDPRQTRRPITSFLYFAKDRWVSGDMKGLTLPEASKLISKEWRSLDAQGRKHWEDKTAAMRRRYEQEFQTVYKHPVKPARLTRPKAEV